MRPMKHDLTADELDSIAESELAKHPAAARIVRNVATMLRSATKTMTGTEVMSKYVTQAEGRNRPCMVTGLDCTRDCAATAGACILEVESDKAHEALP